MATMTYVKMACERCCSARSSAGNGDGEIGSVVMSGVENGHYNFGCFDAIGTGLETNIDAIQFVFQIAAEIEETILAGAMGNVNDEIGILRDTRAGGDLCLGECRPL